MSIVDVRIFVFLMIPRPPRSTRTDTRVPDTTPFRSTNLHLLPPDEREARKAALVARLRKYNRTAMIVEPHDLSVDPIQLMRQSVADPTQGSVAAKAWINEAPAIGQGPTDVDKHHHDAR